MSGTDLVWLRVVAFLPLVVITFQVIMLRRILNSRAWNLLVAGFVFFVVTRGSMFLMAPPAWGLLLATFTGYTLIIAGFHLLRRDLLRVLRATIVVDDGKVHTGRRKDDPKPGPVLLQDPKYKEDE